MDSDGEFFEYLIIQFCKSVLVVFIAFLIAALVILWGML